MLSTQTTGALPGTQGQRGPPPLSIQIRQNVRIEDRIDTMLGPSDAKYQDTEKYFATLLEDMDWTIARILDEHFSPHEAKKFIPTRESPWAEWQADDTRAFGTLLQARFKGVKPTLSMKMALLYHGFAVAPLKIGPVQDVEPQDYQHFTRRENRVIQDPLAFLEGYTERTWGETPLQLPSQPRRVPLVTEAMGLRGGALDDAEMGDIMPDEEAHVNTGNAGHIKSNTRRVVPPSLFVRPRRARYTGEKEAMDKKTTMYNSQAEFRSGSGTHESMRKQAWWAPPSIFANPLKPVMPLHAAPLETVIRTGPSVPSVSLGLRTATEMARLEREVHMLRGQVLDRNRECPYHDCHRFFHYLDTKSLEDHLTQEHPILRCTLCLAFSPAQKHAGMLYMDRKHIIEHVVSEHSEQLRTFISVPTGHHAMPSQPPTSTGLIDPMNFPASFASKLGSPFCDRCGRDNTKCCEVEDVKNHMFRCAEPDWSPDNGSPPAYCESCGTKTGSRWPDRSCHDRNCASHNPDIPDEENFCRKCGLRWHSNHSEAYKAQHGSGCRFLGGTTDSFCIYCGVSLRGLDARGVQEHGQQVCMTSPKPSGTLDAKQYPPPEGYGEGGSSKDPAAASWSSSSDRNVNRPTSKSKTSYPWTPSSKRPTADPQDHPRLVKKQRQIPEDSGSEVSSDGEEGMPTDSDDEGEYLPTDSDDSEYSPSGAAPRKGLFLKHRDISGKPREEEASGTKAREQEQTNGVSAHQTSQPPASHQGSAAPAATAAQPSSSRRSATPAAWQALVARQNPAAPATSSAGTAGTGAAQARGAAGLYPWCGPKVATPSAAAATPTSARESPAPAAAQEAPMTTRSGRTVRKTRAAAELQAKKSTQPAGQDDDNAANVKMRTAKKGRPRKPRAQ